MLRSLYGWFFQVLLRVLMGLVMLVALCVPPSPTLLRPRPWYRRWAAYGPALVGRLMVAATMLMIVQTAFHRLPTSPSYQGNRYYMVAEVFNGNVSANSVVPPGTDAYDALVITEDFDQEHSGLCRRIADNVQRPNVRARCFSGNDWLAPSSRTAFPVT